MYTLTPIRIVLKVSHMVTVHYFEYSKDYQFNGESHDFWELLYVDKGRVEVYADDIRHQLQQGQLIMHKPNEWHTVKAIGHAAPNLVVIAFHAKGTALQSLENLVTILDQTGKQFLSVVLAEGKAAYASDLGDPELKTLIKNKKAIPGCEQMLKNALESLLIHLFRQTLTDKSDTPLIQNLKTTADVSYSRILEYIDMHISQPITLKDLAAYTLLSIPSIERLMHSKHHCGAIAYIQHYRIEKAKHAIREGHHNFSELANQLGFRYIHYFSRVFKKQTGMTLTEYTKTLR